MVVNGATTSPEPWMDHGDNMDTDYDVWELRHGIDDFVRSEFTTGYCTWLAFAIHERTGWPILGELDGDGWHMHVWVRNPDGRAVDINGIHPTDFARTKYNDPRWLEKHGMLHELREDGTVEDITDRVFDFYSKPCPELDWARQIVDGFPEHFGLPAPTPKP